MLTNLVQKVPEKYMCLVCDYSSSRKSQYDRHILTAKHQKLTKTNHLSSEGSKSHLCEQCNKIYKSRVGLWSHKKVCNVGNIGKNDDSTDKDQLILMLIKENSEFKNMLMEQQKQIMEVIKNGTTNTNKSN
jgi:hypothetical protein